MKQILLDTNAYTKLLSGDTTVLDILGRAETVYMSIFVIGELLAGFKGGTKEQNNKKLLDSFLLKPTVKIISATIDTAEFFANIKDGLRRKGKPIPINDIWIAAHAMESASMLVSFDAHFGNVDGLIVWENSK